MSEEADPPAERRRKLWPIAASVAALALGASAVAYVLTSEPTGCEKLPACPTFGQCTSAEPEGELVCKATRTEDCAASLGCREYGACDVNGKRWAGYCWPTDERHCKESSACREHGACSLETDPHVCRSCTAQLLRRGAPVEPVARKVNAGVLRSQGVACCCPETRGASDP